LTRYSREMSQPLRDCYVDARVRDGSFRHGDPAVAARFIVEIVTFFARHRHLDPDPLPHDDKAIRESVIPLIMGALVSVPRVDDDVSPRVARKGWRRDVL
jgi:hypothetical protein